MLIVVVLLPVEPPRSSRTLVSVADAGGAQTLTLADASALGRQVDGVAALSRIVSASEQVTAGDRSALVPINAVDPAYLDMHDQSLAQGTFFTAQDSASAQSVAVLGQRVAADLFAGRPFPLGQSIRIRNVTFVVRGVLATTGDDADSAILIPLQTGQVRLFGPTALSEVALEVEPDQVEAVRTQVNALLRGRHQLRAGQADDFAISTSRQETTVTTPASTLQRMVEITRDVTCTAKGLCAPTP
jgi:ABC-type lipoprotein release transport system permease subunit